MSTAVIPEVAKPSQFRFATTHRTEDGFEFVIIAKSQEELCRTWQMIAGPVAFDESKVSEVKINRE